MTPSVDEVAASLRGMGYSEGQARALAGDPQGEPRRLSGRIFRDPATIAPPRQRAPRTRKATDGRPVAVGHSPDSYRRDRRWGVQRKAVMIELVRDGLVAIPDLWTRYGITAEEFTAWCAAFDHGSLKGLRATTREGRAP